MSGRRPSFSSGVSGVATGAPSSTAASSSTRRGPPSSSTGLTSLHAHSGSGSNTSLRAQLRREREARREANGGSGEGQRMPPSASAPAIAQSSAAAAATGAAPRGQANTAPQSLPLQSKSETNMAALAAQAQAHAVRLASLTPQAIPDPPDAYEHSFGTEALQAAFSAKYYEFSAKYYELAKKCRDWERFAAKLRAQAEALASENRLLRGVNAEQEESIERLERENAALREDTRIRQAERRRMAERLATLEARLAARTTSSRDDLNASFHGHEAGRTSSALDRYAAPSPPSSLSLSRTLGNSTDGARGDASMPWCSSNLLLGPANGLAGGSAEEDKFLGHDLRPPSPLNHIGMPGDPHYAPRNSSSAGSLARTRSSSSINAVPAPPPPNAFQGRPQGYGHAHKDSLADIVVADAANREAGALYGEGRASRLANLEAAAEAQAYASHAHHTGQAEASERGHPREVSSNSQESGSYTGRLHVAQRTGAYSGANGALTAQALAYMDGNQHDLRTASSSGDLATLNGTRSQDPAQRTTVSPNRVVKRHTSLEGAAVPKRRSTNANGSVISTAPEHKPPDMNGASLPALVSQPGGLSLPAGPPLAGALGGGGSESGRRRGVSGQSDEGTVMGEYLAGALEARKQLRRISLSQQQQLHALQSQERQVAVAAAAAELGHGLPPLVGHRPPSRTASRMSNVSAGGRSRSRADSSSVHDAIPVVKDDVFSDAPLVGRESALGGRTVSGGQATLQPSRSAPSGLQQQAPSRGPSPLPLGADAALRSLNAPALLHTKQRSHGDLRAPSRVGMHDSDGENVPAPTAWDPATGAPINGRDTPSPPSRPRSHDALKPGAAMSAHERAASRSTSSSGLRSDAELSSNASNQHLAGAAAPRTAEQSEEDKRGAHRRLYMRLRAELDEAELGKFERYVHRYDALEIPIDGPRGLVNRVKKLLLLSDAGMRERDPERFRGRKDLAREFERIVRVDLEAE